MLVQFFPHTTAPGCTYPLSTLFCPQGSKYMSKNYSPSPLKMIFCPLPVPQHAKISSSRTFFGFVFAPFTVIFNTITFYISFIFCFLSFLLNIIRVFFSSPFPYFPITNIEWYSPSPWGISSIRIRVHPCLPFFLLSIEFLRFQNLSPISRHSLNLVQGEAY